MKNPFRAAFHFGKNGCCQMTLGKMRATVLGRGDRTHWNAILSSKEGRRFELQCTPLANGHTLIELGPSHKPAMVAHQKSVA